MGRKYGHRVLDISIQINAEEGKKMFREINEVDYRVKHAQTSGSIWALYPVHIKTIFYKAISLLYISPSLKKRGENIISNKQIMYISFKPNHADQAPIPSEYALYQYLGARARIHHVSASP
jgi:hypothetical protein